MDQLNEAISIAIIGGADGPTSIYISKQSLWILLMEMEYFRKQVKLAF